MFLTASRIHDGHAWLPPGTVIEVSEDGLIVALHAGAGEKEVVTYDGILCPGFVNVHCHMELSHMKGIIPANTGLIPFLQQVMSVRNNFTDEQKQQDRYEAYYDMLANGIVAVGDIANGEDSLDLRALDLMHVHTFIESTGFTETYAQQRFDAAVKTCQHFAAQQGAGKILRQSIAPHAPYSVSAALFRLIDAHNEKALTCIHNEESFEEIKYYTDKTGAVNDLLGGFNINSDFFTPSGKSSLQTYLEYFKPSHPFIFVHNTYTAKADVLFAQDRMKETYWCLCPNANIYIENRLPDIDMLLAEARTICIGTDSLASNHQLSVLSELYTIKENFPHIDWELLLRWATLNGAAALQMQDVIGTLAPGKRPGILQLTGLDHPTNQPLVKRIV